MTNSWKDERQRLTAARSVLSLRAAVLKAVRRFFAERDFLEVETPVRLQAPPPEPHIDAEPSGDQFLRTSPELHMKRLLAAGYPRVFQMGPCFRRGERGRHHHPEYTMLEWYRARAGYADVRADTEALTSFVALQTLGRTVIAFRGVTIDLAPPWEQWTVSAAFRKFAGWDPTRDFDADRFDRDLVERVEPALPRTVPVILTDYPAPAAALARLRPGHPPLAERWELYIGGLEIANAFGELTDPAEQRRRFAEWSSLRTSGGKPTYPLDETFLEALGDMPRSAGVALGVDRLVMVLANADSLDGVLPFREPAA